MGCGNSTSQTEQPVNKNQNYNNNSNNRNQGQNNPGLPPKVQKNQQDLMFARKHVKIPQIKHEESFLPVQRYNPEDISTQIVSKQPLTKYQTQKQSLGGQKFEDQDFPANIESLTPSIDLMQDSDLYEWKRIADIFPGKNIEIFQGQIEPNDIVQGALGDCYFLSALSSLAERPILIQKLFLDRSVNQESIFGVLLCIDGEFQEVIIDDFFPSLDGQIAFSNSNQRDLETLGAELWVIILEKAYAKMYGSYQQIDGGQAEQAIRDLTGAPYENIFTQKKGIEETWKFLTSNDKKGYILTAGTKYDGKGTEEEQEGGKGIVSNHAYAVLDAQSIQYQGQEVRLVKARNPWGKNEWTGDWSDKSDKWTPELRRQLDVKDVDDGIFWIPLENFVEQFEEVAINYVNEGYLYTSKRINFAHEDAQNILLVTFSVQNDNTHIYLEITQKDLRHFYKDEPYEYSWVQIMVCNNDFTEWKGEKMGPERNLTLEGTYNKGTYTAYIQIDWSGDSQGVDFVTFSTYSSSQVLICDDVEHLHWDDTAVLDSMLICQPPERDDRFHRYEEDEDIVRYEGQTPGYIYFQYVNNSQKGSTLKEFVHITELEHIEIMPPYDNSDEFEVVVKPGESQLVKYRINNFDEEFRFNCEFSTQVSMNEEQLMKEVEENHEQNKEERQDYQVWFSTFKHSGGIVLYYHNDNQDDQLYYENLELQLDNLIPVDDEGELGDKIDLEVEPGQTYIIKLEVDDPTKGFSYSSSCSYGLK